MYVRCTYVLCKGGGNLDLSIFIHGDILVLVSEFVVMAILSQWWLVSTAVGTSLVLYFLLKESMLPLFFLIYCVLTTVTFTLMEQSSLSASPFSIT